MDQSVVNLPQDTKIPERTALLLATDGDSLEDGLLQDREIRDLRVAADLVTLSACDTGIGRLQGQEGISSLVGSFLLALSSVALAISSDPWALQWALERPLRAAGDTLISSMACRGKQSVQDECMDLRPAAECRNPEQSGFGQPEWRPPRGQQRIDLFDGDTGTKASTIDNVTLVGERWFQFNSILATYAPGARQGYARITPTSIENRFTAYAVINDGAATGERTGEAAFISSSP